MTAELTIKEVQADYAATLRDIERCAIIAANVRLFMEDSVGEDRSKFKMDVFKWEALLSQARRLRDKIQLKLEELSK